MEEAEPMFRENFEAMKLRGQIPKHIHWSEEVFRHGFNEVDDDGNGVIDKKEMTNFAQTFLHAMALQKWIKFINFIFIIIE